MRIQRRLLTDWQEFTENILCAKPWRKHGKTRKLRQDTKWMAERPCYETGWRDKANPGEVACWKNLEKKCTFLRGTSPTERCSLLLEKCWLSWALGSDFDEEIQKRAEFLWQGKEEIISGCFRERFRERESETQRPMTKEEPWQEKAKIFIIIYCRVSHHVAFSFISP